MKTMKIIFSIAGFALTTLCFGQLLSHINNDVLVYTSYYDAENMRYDHRVEEFPVRTTSGDLFESDVMITTYFVPLETDLEVESWMTTPFESSVYEEELQIESWMTTPFESNYFEEEIQVEEWMTKIWI